MRISFISALFAAVLTTTPVAAELIPGSRSNVGVWLITAHTDNANRHFSHCTMNSGYRSGIDMYFGVSSNLTWRVGWMHPNWRLTDGQEVPIVFWIDEFEPRRLDARVSGPRMVIAELPATREVFDQFRRGFVLRVRAADTTYAFNLTDTYAALTAMIDCVDRYKAVASAPPPAPPAPRAAPPPPAPTTAQPSTKVTAEQRLEATKVVANLMARSQLSGFHILSSTEVKALNTDAFNQADVVWRAEGVVGMLTIIPRALASSSDQIASGLLGDDARSCKANFASGSMADEKSATVRRVFTACAGGKTDFNIRYIIMPVADGTHYVFATAALGQSGGNEVVSKTEGLLREALYEVMNR